MVNIYQSIKNTARRVIAPNTMALFVWLLVNNTATAQCTFTTSFGSATINTSGTAVTISTCSFAGEYSTINGAVAGQTLQFTSSVGTDFITIHSGTPNGPVIASGTTPLVFANTFTGTIYAHWATGPACGTESTCRTTVVQCTSCTPPPPPANDLCANAINIPYSCTPVLTTGTTLNSTLDNAGTCITSNTTAGVWYTVLGNGGDITSTTCSVAVYDTKLSVFTTPDCATFTCVTGNDDDGNCSVDATLSTVTFTSTLGQTYYILVHGFGGETGAFELTTTFEDVIPPSITCPANITQGNDAGVCEATVNFSVTGTDACGGAVNIVSTPASGSVFALGTTTVTSVATDASGNSSTCSFDITVTDTEGPALNGCPSNLSVDADAGLCSAVVTFATPTVSDNCPSVAGSLSSTFAGGNNHRGNMFDLTALNTLTVTSLDGHPMGNTDIAVYYKAGTYVGFETNAAAWTLAGTATGVVAQPFGSPTPIPVALTVTIPAGQTYAFYVTSTNTGVSLNYTNGTAVGNVYASDANLQFKEGAGLEYPFANGGAVFQPRVWNGIIHYALGGVNSVVQTAGLASGSAFPVGTTTNTFTGTDAVGNTSACSFDVVVADNEKPAIICPGNITQTNDAGICGAVVTFSATATDNCSGVSVLSTPASGSTFAVGTTTVTAVATDAAGNTDTCTFDITITDDENPVVSCPGNITQSNDAGLCGAVVTFNATATDNCSGVSVVSSPASGSTFALGTTTVTSVATDAAGHTATCTFDITITDDEDPVISCPGSVSVSADAGQCSSSAVVLGNPSTSDNCTGAVTVSSDAPATYPVGTTTVTWTATDAAGNTSTCTQTVTVTDDEDPVISGCPSNISGCDAVVSWTSPSVSDNCSGASLLQTSGPASGSTFTVGTTTITYTATDAGGNTASCSFDVTVYPTPVVNLGGPYTSCAGSVTLDAGNAGSSYVWSEGSTSQTLLVNTSGSYSVTVTNGNGCSASGTADVTINTPPTVTAYSICQGGSVPVGSGLQAVNNCPGSSTIVNSFTGTIDLSDPTFTRSLGGTSYSASGVGTAVHYETNTFTVSTSGSYTFTICGAGNWDTYLHIYQNSFNAASPATNFLLAQDDAGPCSPGSQASITLTAGNTYVFVTTAFDNTGVGAYTVTWTGPGTVSTGTVVPLEWYTGPVGGSSIGSGNVFNPVGVSGSGLTNTNTAVVTTYYVACASSPDCRTAVDFTINATPVVSLGGPYTQCGDSVTLDAGNAGASYIWNDGSTSQTLSVSASGSYSVTVTSGNGCSASGTANVTIQSVPTVNLGGPYTQCGDSVTLDAGNSVGSSLLIDEGLNSGTGTTPYTPAGWLQQNNSVPAGTTVWFNGNTSVFTPNSGAGYIAANFNSTTGANVISNWLFTPNITMNNGDKLTFYTRTVTSPLFPDRLQVRMSTNGASTNVGAGSAAVGDFSNLLIDINPTLTTSDYPTSWTQYTATLSGLSGPTSGRLAFRYFVADGGPSGNNSDYIGIDDVQYTSTASGATYAWSEGSGTQTITVGASGTYTVTVTGSNGCSASASASVTINEIPTVDLGSDITQCPGSATLDAGNTGSSYAWSTGETSQTISVTANGSYSVTVTTVNNCTAADTIEVTFEDTTPPTISCPAAVSVSADAGQCSASGVNLGSATVSDNCSGVTSSNDAPATFPLGTTTVTWTATDAAGHTATCTQTVTVTDDEDPVISCPGSVSVSADAGQCSSSAVVLGTPTTSDNCTGAVTVSSDAPATFPVGTTTVTWTATDAAGNTSTCTQTVTVTDDEDPVITCPTSVIVSADAGQCSASGVNLGSATASDNCSGATSSNNAPATFPIGTTTVTWTATDAAGNTSTCSQTVTVTDDEDPVITCPVAVSVSADAGQCSASGVNLGSATLSDNCNGVTSSNDAPATFPLGITTVTWTATDAAGNTATCTQLVTVTDDEDPVITCPAAVSVSADAGQCSSSAVVLGTPTTSDNCTGAVTTSNNAPATFSIGTTTVTWTATDAAGNTSSCTQTVTVTDDEEPVISCPADVSVSADAGLCSTSGVNLGSATVSDNCAGVTSGNNAPATFPIGITTVIWTATDAAGNTATCTQQVTVTDDEDPVITCSPSVSINTTQGQCGASSSALIPPTATDNCTLSLVTSNAPATLPVGTTTVTWTATDASGNTSTCIQVITVIDNQAPQITCPAAVSTQADQGGCTASNVALGTPSTSDNCGVATVTNNAPVSFPVGNTTVLWTVTDVNGNTSTCNQVVSVSGNGIPTISCPSAVSVNADAGLCTASNILLVTPVATGNCGVGTATNDAPSVYPVGNTTVTWTVTDLFGNTASCGQTVTVTDAQLPTITCPADVTANADAFPCVATNVVLGAPVTSDNCGVATVTNNAPSSYPVGITAVTWTVVDVNGNSDTCTQLVTVNASVDTSVSVNGSNYTANATSASFQWFNCTSGSNISGATNASFTPTASGSYAVIVTQNGCTDTSECFNFTFISIGGTILANGFVVYPNPATDQLFIEVKGSVKGTSHIQLFDVAGQIVRDVYVDNLTGVYAISLDDLASAVYELRVNTISGVWNTKVMKIK